MKYLFNKRLIQLIQPPFIYSMFIISTYTTVLIANKKIMSPNSEISQLN